MIAPFNTMILNSSRLTLKVMCILYLVLHFYISGAIIFPPMWNYVLSSIISHEFKKCTKMVHDIVKHPESAKKNFEIVRCRHQTLCRMVDKIDGQVCVNAATYVVGLIFLIILYLYILICISDLTSDPFFLCVALFWIFSGAFGLIIVAHGGIMINQSVRVR